MLGRGRLSIFAAMIAKRTYLMLAALLCCMASSAQKRLIVIDWDTRIPVDGANVVGKGLTVQTDSMGVIAVPDSCRSLLFSHVNYESRLVNIEEVRDTVYLLSKLLTLKEVVVVGQAPFKDDDRELNKRLRLPQKELELAAANPAGGVNILPLIKYLIPKKWRKNSKKERREQLKRAIEEY